MEQLEKRENILQEINAERDKQDAKWGEQNHSPIEWCAILGEEVGEVNKAALEDHFGHKAAFEACFGHFDKAKSLEDYRKELIQVAAVAVSMIESLDRNHLKP